MIRKLVLSASAVALAAAGWGFASVGSASASTTITAGAGSSVNCDILGTVKLKPPLKDNYIQADHASDPDGDVVALPDHNYAPAPPEGTSGKAASTSCTGTAKQGLTTATITKVAVALVNDPAHGTSTQGTCVDLAKQGLGQEPPSTGEYIVTVKYTSGTAGVKIAPTTITDAHLNVPAASLDLVGGTISGSFSGTGGTAETNAMVDSTTIAIFTQELFGPAPDGTTVATSTSPAAPNVCQSSLKIKTGPHHSASEKGPKGLKAIGAIAGSTFSASR